VPQRLLPTSQDQKRVTAVKILNSSMQQDLDQGIPLKLDLGSGGEQQAGFYSVDLLALPGVDMVADLEQPLDQLPDNCAAYVYSRHTLEHISRLIPLLAEIRRITQPTGSVEIIVPHFSNPHYYSDPTHVRPFGLYSMAYFVATEKQTGVRKVPCFYSDVRFIQRSVEIDFYYTSWLDRLVAPFMRRLANHSPRTQEFFERRLASRWHARQMRYLLQPDK